MSAPAEAMIDVRGLSRSFGAVRAVDGLDLTVRRGELFGLVGPDGAGKTTTLRLLVGALAPSAGGGRVAGLDLTRDIERIRHQIGYVAQRFSLYGDLTVMENITFTADLFSVPRRVAGERAKRLLALTGLTAAHDRRAELLSGGMKQKLALACALVHEPALLVLDEPTNGVDPVSRREFWRLLVGLLADGATILVSTAYLDEAELCRRVGFMAGGRVLISGTPDEIKATARACLLEVRAAPRQPAAAAARAVPGVRDVRLFGDRLHVAFPVEVPVAAAEAAVRAGLTAAGLSIEGIRPIAPSLEDAVIGLTLAAGAGDAADRAGGGEHERRAR